MCNQPFQSQTVAIKYADMDEIVDPINHCEDESYIIMLTCDICAEMVSSTRSTLSSTIPKIVTSSFEAGTSTKFVNTSGKYSLCNRYYTDFRY